MQNQLHYFFQNDSITTQTGNRLNLRGVYNEKNSKNYHRYNVSDSCGRTLLRVGCLQRFGGSDEVNKYG